MILRSAFKVLRGNSFFFIPATTANNLWNRRISIPDLIHHNIFSFYFLRKSQLFPFQCWVPNKGITGTIFITSLVWRCHWLWFEPGTSRTRSQHSTTRLSRRRYRFIWEWRSLNKTTTYIYIYKIKQINNGIHWAFTRIWTIDVVTHLKMVILPTRSQNL